MSVLLEGKTVKLMAKAGRQASGTSVNVLGITFKENLSDLRSLRQS